MMLKLLDALFGCSHDRLTFPRTSERSGRAKGTYVVCLDCGKEFAYDWALMKVILKQNQASEPAAEPAPVKVHAA
jgi:hypothetical protein